MASEDLQHTLFTCDEPVADSQNLESSPLSLHEAVAEIVALARRSDKYTVNLAVKVAELKKRLVRGEAGLPVRWSVWIAEETRLSRQYVYFLAKIGSSGDPHDALKEAQKGWREEKLSDGMSQNHRLIMRLIPKLSAREATDVYVKLFKNYRSRAG